MRRSHKERDAMLTTCSWTGALLAAQRLARDAAAREAAGEAVDVRHTSVCRFRWIAAGTRLKVVKPKNLMGNFGYQQFAERHRPHIHPPGAILFVTYRLVGSVPQSTVSEYRAKKEWLDYQLKRAQEVSFNDEAPEVSAWLQRVEEFNRDWFLKFEEILHKSKVGPMWMQDENVAAKVAESLSQLDGKAYRLLTRSCRITSMLFSSHSFRKPI